MSAALCLDRPPRPFARCLSRAARAAAAAPAAALGCLPPRLRTVPSLPLATAAVAGFATLLLVTDVVGRVGSLARWPAASSPAVLAAAAIPPVEPPKVLPPRSPASPATHLAEPAGLPEPAAGPADALPGGERPAVEAASAPMSASWSPLPVVPDVPAELDDIARELQRRRAEVLELEAGLALREAALRAAEADLSAQIDRLEAFQQELEALVGEAEAEEEERLQQLVKVYESMRAKSAAAIFDRLELPVILAVATRMREARMAAILAAMDPNRAKIVTSELARERELPRLD
jgi:hypothetical protein